MLHPVSASKPGQNGMTGSGGPAPGIRSPARTDVTTGGSARVQSNRDGSVSFSTGQRLSSRIVTSQQTQEPVTPLKTRAESMRGRNNDAQA